MFFFCTTIALLLTARPASSAIEGVLHGEESPTHHTKPLTKLDILRRREYNTAYATYSDFTKRSPLRGSWSRRVAGDKREEMELIRYEECILTSPIAMDESQYRVRQELRKFNQTVFEFFPLDFRLRSWEDEATRRLGNRTILFLGDSLQKYQAVSFACQLAASSGSGELLPLYWAHHAFNEGADMETKRQSSFCARFEVTQSVVCWWSSGKARGRQLGVAYRAACVVMHLSPRDLVVASTGVHYKHPTYGKSPSNSPGSASAVFDHANMRMLSMEATSLRKTSAALRWVCPHVVWRETAPQFWPDGFYPANVVNSAEHPDSRVEQCAPWRVANAANAAANADADGQKDHRENILRRAALDKAVNDLSSREATQYNYYNSVLLRSLWGKTQPSETSDLPVLNIFWPTSTRTMFNLNLELTAQALRQPYDCTHFTMVGNVYRFWNQLVLTEFIAFEDSYGGGGAPKKKKDDEAASPRLPSLVAGHLVTTDTERDAIEALGLSAPSIKEARRHFDALLASNGGVMSKSTFRILLTRRSTSIRPCPLSDGLFDSFDLDKSNVLEFGEILVGVATFGTYTDQQVRRLCSDITSITDLEVKNQVDFFPTYTDCDCNAVRKMQAALQEFLFASSLKYFPVDTWPRCRDLDCRWERANVLLQINQSKANFNNNERPKPFVIPRKFLDAAEVKAHSRWDIKELLSPRA